MLVFCTINGRFEVIGMLHLIDSWKSVVVVNDSLMKYPVVKHIPSWQLNDH
jgi:hypothetical protein